MQRIRNAVGLLRSGKIHIHPILVTLIAVRGLDSSYEAVKHDFSVQSDKYANLDLETLNTRCETFASDAKTVQSDAATLAAAAAEVAPNTRNRSHAQGSFINPHYPPQERVHHTQVMTQLGKGKTECPLCFNIYPFIKCSKALEAGYVVKYDPTKAKVAFNALDSDQMKKKKTGK